MPLDPLVVTRGNIWQYRQNKLAYISADLACEEMDAAERNVRAAIGDVRLYGRLSLASGATFALLCLAWPQIHSGEGRLWLAIPLYAAFVGFINAGISWCETREERRSHEATFAKACERLLKEEGL